MAEIFPEAEVIGADISPTAVKICTEFGIKNNLKFIEVDFFDPTRELGCFDLIFDHTFFCAINPEMRPLWGERMKTLLNKFKETESKETGYLLTIIFPLPRDPLQGINLNEGPPFEVTFESYSEVLSDKLVCCARWSREHVPESNEKRKGREELALWQRK